MNKTRINKRAVLKWLPAVAVMILIFIFSAMEGDESSDTSMKFLQPLINAYNEILHKNITPSLEEALHFIIRKIAHFTEYAILGASISFARFDEKEKRLKAVLMALLCSAIYAATDEFHQYFVPGRYASITDVCIDSYGALTGILIFLWIKRKIIKRRGQVEKV